MQRHKHLRLQNRWEDVTLCGAQQEARARCSGTPELGGRLPGRGAGTLGFLAERRSLQSRLFEMRRRNVGEFTEMNAHI